MAKEADPNETRAPTIIGVVSFVLSIATIAVALRIYTRARVVRAFGTDDGIAIFSLLLIFACGFCVAWNTRYGFGKHTSTLSPEQLYLYTRTFYVSIIFYNAALLGIKMTFLFQYYRLFSALHIRTLLITTMVVVGCWGISQVGIEIFICNPIEAFWDKSLRPTAKCIPDYPQWYINAAGNIATDIAIFVLPLPFIRKLSLERVQKIVLIGIFSLGFFTVMISFIRIKFLRLTEDFTWDNIESAGWSVGELCSGLTCACLPTLRPLFARWCPCLSTKLLSTVTKRSYSTDTEAASQITYTDPEPRSPVTELVAQISTSEETFVLQSPTEEGDMRFAHLPKRPDNFLDSASSEEVLGDRLKLRPDREMNLDTRCLAGRRSSSFTRQGTPVRVNCEIEQVETPRRVYR